MDIADWLHRLGLGQYEQAFRDNAVDAEILPRLTAEDLRELGVTAIGHRRKLLDAIAALPIEPVPQQAAAASPAVVSPPDVESGERRQVTVLFADLAGFTAMSRELDSEEVHALLGQFFTRADRIIHEHGGHIDKHVGDCVMAVFGAPVAHGNDGEHAVRAALAVRDVMPAVSAAVGRLVRAHIGVATGQVVASGTGSERHREYTVTGDSVNLASRLADAAKPDEILVSDMVHRALADRLECEPAETLAVKGFAAPVMAWRLHSVRMPSDRGLLVGRRGELRQFRAVLEACTETGRGQAVCLRGEAGIGKTRLLEAFQDMARQAGFACHAGLVLDFGAGTGRDAIRGLVRDLLQVGAGADMEAARATVQRAVQEGLVAADDVVFLNDLLDLAQPTDLRARYEAMDNPARNRGKRETIARLVEYASARQPRLLAIEDVHWADPRSLVHLARLAAAAASCPAILVMTTRTEGDPLDSAWRGETGATPLLSIDLGPLHPDEARAFAENFLAANAALAERCLERAAGNPLFLEQLIRHAEDAAETGVPGSVQSLVQARLDRLGRADRAAIQAASVLGQRFSPEALEYVLEGSDDALRRLTAELLVRPHGEEFLFAHALIRDAVYDGLLRSRRRELHRRAADWFAGRDAALQAGHLDRAGDPSAARAYFAAARSQAAAYRYETALQLAERGLELAADQVDRFALGCMRGDILRDLGAMPDALGAYQDTLAAASDDAERCRVWIGLASVKRVTEDLAGAFADLDLAEAAAVANGLLVEEARLRFLRGNLFFPRGDIEGCLHEHGRSLELARRAGAAEEEAAALGGLGDAEYVRGRMISSHDRLSACVELARRQRLGRTEVANLAQMAHTMVYFRPQAEALQAALDAAEAAAKVGHLRAELNARVAACFALSNLADVEAGRRQTAVAQALIRRLGAWRFEASCLRPLGRSVLAEGRRAEAQQMLRETVEVCRKTSMSFEGPRALGTLALAVEDPKERRQMLAEAEEIIRAGCVGHNPLWFYTDAIEVALELADYDEAERFATALQDYTRPEPLPWGDFFIARGRVLAAFGQGKEDDAIRSELKRLRDEAGRLGLMLALPRLEAALSMRARTLP